MKLFIMRSCWHTEESSIAQCMCNVGYLVYYTKECMTVQRSYITHSAQISHGATKDLLYPL